MSLTLWEFKRYLKNDDFLLYIINLNLSETELKEMKCNEQ